MIHTRMMERRLLCFMVVLVTLLWPPAASGGAPDDLGVPTAPSERPDLIDRPTFDPPAREAAPPARVAPFDIEHELAGQFMRHASLVLRSFQPPSVQVLEVALILAQEATDLNPEDVEAWYLFLSLAMLNERDDLVRVAVNRLAELDTKNDVILLRKLRSEIEQAQTAGERAAGYERAIGRTELPATIRSRLAYDLAILERRRGRTESFATWLAESVALDRSNATAAALAAGYFRLHVDDPVASGELLFNQFLANPTDISAQMLAANHFLAHGAYDAAHRLLKLAKRSYEALLPVPTPGDLLADKAIAQWGAGHPAEALAQVLEYQRRRDVEYHEYLLLAEPDLSPMERAQRRAMLPVTVAVTGAALYVRLGDEEGREVIAQLLKHYEQLIEEAMDDARSHGMQDNEAVKSEIARSWLEAAWLCAWLSPNPDEAERYLTKASELVELSGRARARISGWIALRHKDYDAALELLEPHAQDDASAGLGYANALLGKNQQRSAAREFLRIARMQPGSLIGVWANDQLAELLGRRAPLSNEAAMLNSLLDDMPRFLDRFPTHPTTLATVRAQPVKNRYGPFEPILINLEITNHTPRPLAIDPEGPILPDVALLLRVRITGAASQPKVDPIIVNIDRRIRLEPRERLTIPIDLRRTALGAVLDRHALFGAIVTIRAVSNFFLTPEGAVSPTLLGAEHHGSPINIEGKRLTVGMVDEWFSELTQQPERADAREIALLMNYLIHYSFRNLGQAEMQSLVRSLLSIGQAYQRLDPLVQTWLLSILPTSTAALRPILESARQSDHRLVQLGLFAFGPQAIAESNLRAMAERDDPRLRRLARIFLDSPEEFDMLDDQEVEQTPSALDRELPPLQRDDAP